MAIFSSSHANRQAKTPPIGGLVNVFASLNPSATGTASSQLLYVKIPHRAVLQQFFWSIQDGGTNQTWDLGFGTPAAGGGPGLGSLTQSSLLGTLSNSGSGTVVTHLTGNVPLLNWPRRLSLSDDHAFGWLWIAAVASAAISASARSVFSCIYSMADNND